MTQSDDQVQYSEDRNYWWDEHDVDVAAGRRDPSRRPDRSAPTPGRAPAPGSGSAAPPAQPAMILLTGGESSWEPDPVLVGQPITVKWREYNAGGPSEAYTTNVALKKGNDVENELDVSMDPLGEHETQWREAQLTGPVGVDLDYAIEIFVDSKNAQFHNENRTGRTWRSRSSSHWRPALQVGGRLGRERLASEVSGASDTANPIFGRVVRRHVEPVRQGEQGHVAVREPDLGGGRDQVSAWVSACASVLLAKTSERTRTVAAPVPKPVTTLSKDAFLNEPGCFG